MLELTNSLDETFYIARRAAIDFAVPLVTNVEQVLEVLRIVSPPV